MAPVSPKTDGEDSKRWCLFHHSNQRKMGRMARVGACFTNLIQEKGRMARGGTCFTILIQEKWGGWQEVAPVSPF